MPRVQVEKDGRRYELYVEDAADLPKAVAHVTAAPATEEPASFLGRRVAGGARVLSLVTRGLAEGLLDPAAWVADQGRQGLGWLTGQEVRPRGSRDAVEQTLDAIFPKPQGAAERALHTAAETVILGGLSGAALATRAGRTLVEVPKLLQQPGASLAARGGNLLTRIGRSFSQSPNKFLALEAAGGGGASLGSDLGAQTDTTAGTVAGGLAGGLAATVAPQSAYRLAELPAHLWQRFSPGGPSGRAGRKLAKNRERELTNEQVQDLLNRETAPITGPRTLDDPGLLRLEKQLANDDPAFRRRVNAGLAKAESATLDELAALGKDVPEGLRRTRWQQRVLAAASPDGRPVRAELPPAMAKEVSDRFRKAYAELSAPITFSSERAQTRFRRELLRAFRTAIDDPRALAKKGARTDLRRWVGSHFKDWLRREDRNLLDFRTFVRSRARALARAGAQDRRAKEQAMLLRNVDEVLTARINSELDEGQRTALAALDRKYRDYKTVEDAINRNTTNNLLPNDLDSALRARSSSAGRLARGEAGPLSELAAVGFDVREALGKSGKQDQRLLRAYQAADAAGQQAISRQLIASLSAKATDSNGILKGPALAKHLRENRETLIAGGLTATDLNNLQRLAERLTLLQRPPGPATSPDAEDALGFFSHVAAGVMGAHSAKRLTKLTNTQGPGILALTGIMARTTRNTLRRLKVARGMALLQDAMEPTPEGRKLLASLLVTRNDPLPKRRAALRQVHAWLTTVPDTTADDE